jgi:hypothetical protein
MGVSMNPTQRVNYIVFWDKRDLQKVARKNILQERCGSLKLNVTSESKYPLFNLSSNGQKLRINKNQTNQIATVKNIWLQLISDEVLF